MVYGTGGKNSIICLERLNKSMYKLEMAPELKYVTAVDVDSIFTKCKIC